MIGAWWGAGHATTLLVVTGALVAMRAAMPPRIADLCELIVALMLILLGARAVAAAMRDGRIGSVAPHQHGPETAHSHAGAADHVHVGAWTLARRPLLVGVLHGLAGSGALTALLLARAGSVASGLLQATIFALGTVVGMVALTALAGWPMARLGAAGPRARSAMGGAAGLFSLGLGAWWGWPLGVRLLSG